jgi:hypothetical protein
MKKKMILMAVLCMLVSAGAALAQSKANYAGTWELDKSKSTLPDFMQGVESMTLTVTQTDKDITVAQATKRAAQADTMGSAGGRGGMRRGGGGDQTMTYTLDGKETTRDVEGIPGSSGVKIKGSMEKDGKLKLSSSRTGTDRDGQPSTRTTKETWELSADGKTLKIKRESESPRGSMSSDLVFVKKTGDIVTTDKKQ